MNDTRQEVRQHYANVAEGGCGCGPGCCGATKGDSLALGYSAEDLSSVPEGADMGLGCGTPLRFAGLREGETVARDARGRVMGYEARGCDC